MFGLIPFARENTLSNQNLFNYLDNIEKSFFGEMEPAAHFRTDIKDNGNEYLLEAELPGFAKEDIHINVDGDRLEITARHRENKEEKKENYVCRERKFGSFSRSFDMTGIDTEAISAGYQDGILSLHLPKRIPVQPEAKRIEVK